MKNKNPEKPINAMISKLLPPVITALVIVAAASLIGYAVSALGPKKTSSVKVVSSTDVNFITIKDPVSNRTYKMPVDPASASGISTGTDPAIPPVVPQAQTSEGVKNFNRLFKRAGSKDDIQRIDYEEARKLYDTGKAVFVDARGDDAFNSAHIKGAVSLPVDYSPEKLEALKPAFRNKVLVTYCSGSGCHMSDKLAYKLYDSGYKNVIIFFGGWTRWLNQNGPVVAQEKQ